MLNNNILTVGVTYYAHMTNICDIYIFADCAANCDECDAPSTCKLTGCSEGYGYDATNDECDGMYNFNPLSNLMVTQLKMCLATAIHNFK